MASVSGIGERKENSGRITALASPEDQSSNPDPTLSIRRTHDSDGTVRARIPSFSRPGSACA